MPSDARLATHVASPRSLVVLLDVKNTYTMDLFLAGVRLTD